VDNSNHIIELLSVLASDPSPSRGFETQESEFERHQQERQKALGELARLQNNPAVRQMLSRVTGEVSNGSIIVSELSGILRDQVLQRVGKYAAILLPELLRVQAKESSMTNHERFLRKAGTVDPFLGSEKNRHSNQQMNLSAIKIASTSRPKSQSTRFRILTSIPVQISTTRNKSTAITPRRKLSNN
jgi:hypothetical protein